MALYYCEWTNLKKVFFNLEKSKNMNDFSRYEDKELITIFNDIPQYRNDIFNELYLRYSEKLKSYCRYKTKTIEDSKELFQETWIKFHQYLIKEQKFVKLPSYLYVVANNILKSKFRTKKKNILIYKFNVIYDLIVDTFDLHSNIETEDLMKFIMKAIEELDEKYQEVFILKWISGLEYKEIAEIQNENIDCIRKRCQRSLSKVLINLEPIINEIHNTKELK